MSSVDPEAIRANRLAIVEALAEDLAHEIKNPMHSMVINLEVLRRRIERVAEDDSSDAIRYADVVCGELDRLIRRVELLLRLVRPEKSGEPTTLAQVVLDLEELLELERERRHVEIEFVPDAPGVRGHIPRDVGRQVTLNLLLQSLDEVPEGGTLTLRAAADGDGAYLRLSGRPPDGSDLVAPNDASERVQAARSLMESIGGTVTTGAVKLDGGRREDQLLYTVSVPLP